MAGVREILCQGSRDPGFTNRLCALTSSSPSPCCHFLLQALRLELETFTGLCSLGILGWPQLKLGFLVYKTLLLRGRAMEG